MWYNCHVAKKADRPLALEYKQAVGARLREWRLKTGRVQTEVAQLLDISRDRYANYEDGGSEMPYWILAKLDLLGVDLRWLITGRTTKNSTLPVAPFRVAQGD